MLTNLFCDTVKRKDIKKDIFFAERGGGVNTANGAYYDFEATAVVYGIKRPGLTVPACR